LSRSSVTAITYHFLRVDNKQQPGYELVYGAAGVPIYLWCLTPEDTLDATFVASVAQGSVLHARSLGLLRETMRHTRSLLADAHNGMSHAPTISIVMQNLRGQTQFARAANWHGAPFSASQIRTQLAFDLASLFVLPRSK